METTKVWWKSKSILLSIVSGLAVTISAVFPAASAVTVFINNNTALIASVWAVLGIVFRAVSKDKVVLTD